MVFVMVGDEAIRRWGQKCFFVESFLCFIEDIIALDLDEAEVHEDCVRFLLYLGLFYNGYEVFSETAGVASHVPSYRHKGLEVPSLEGGWSSQKNFGSPPRDPSLPPSD